MADADLTTVAVVADVLGVSASEPRLPRLIGAASDAIRAHLGRPQLHYSAAYVDRLPGQLEQVRLWLSLPVVVSVASVVLPDGTTLSPSEYSLEESAYLYRAAGWPYTGLVRSGLLYDAAAVGTEKPSIVVTYAGGWVTPAQTGTRTLPFDLEEAAVQAVVAMYRRGGVDPNIASESLGDYSVAYRTPPAAAGLLPDTVLAQLERYRRLVA